jgi:hypothetical protein
MIKAAKILATLGFLLIILACTLPFNPHFNEALEDILYFRCIMLGSMFALISSAIVFKDDFYLTNINLSLIGGVGALIIVSTSRLIFVFNTKWYFYIPVFVTVGGIIIITLIRLWYRRSRSRKQSLYLKR